MFTPAFAWKISLLWDRSHHFKKWDIKRGGGGVSWRGDKQLLHILYISTRLQGLLAYLLVNSKLKIIVHLQLIKMAMLIIIICLHLHWTGSTQLIETSIKDQRHWPLSTNKRRTELGTLEVLSIPSVTNMLPPFQVHLYQVSFFNAQIIRRPFYKFDKMIRCFAFSQFSKITKI